MYKKKISLNPQNTCSFTQVFTVALVKTENIVVDVASCERKACDDRRRILSPVPLIRIEVKSF